MSWAGRQAQSCKVQITDRQYSVYHWQQLTYLHRTSSPGISFAVRLAACVLESQWVGTYDVGETVGADLDVISRLVLIHEGLDEQRRTTELTGVNDVVIVVFTERHGADARTGPRVTMTYSHVYLQS